MLLFWIVFLIAGCDVNEVDAPVRLFYAYTHDDSSEALAATVWFSGSLEAPRAIFETHLFNFRNVRETLRDTTGGDSLLPIKLSARFFGPWVIGDVLVKFDSTASEQIRNGTYSGWDSLPSGFAPGSALRVPDELGWALIRYRKPYHPRRLAELYRRLPGVIVAEPNYYSSTGEFYSNAIPTIYNNEYGYYFVIGGVAINPYGIYVKIVEGKPVLIGEWNWRAQPRPAWYDEIEAMVTDMGSWDGDSPGSKK